MGVKSTVELTRDQAEMKFRSLYAELLGITMDNSQLEAALERMNDRAHGGEGFENYIIVDD